MTPPADPPSNPYDPNWPKPETPPSGASETPASPFGESTPSWETPSTPTWGEQTAPYAADQPQPGWGQAQSGQQPYGQQPYGQQPYGQVPYGTPTYGAMVASHPSATTALVLGIGSLAGMFVCILPILLAPFAWMVGGRAVKEIDANPGRWSGRDQAQAGRVMGMIGTGILILGILFIVGLVGVAYTSASSYDSDPSPIDSSSESF